MTYLDFRAEADAGTTSWERADPSQALIERTSPVDYRVMLRDGQSVHTVTYGRERGARVGSCDCKGFEFRDDDASPCAHLCVLRKAEFVGALDVTGHAVESVDTAALLDGAEPEPELVTDGGNIEAPDAGHDGCVFGRPEHRDVGGSLTRV